ncbi:MAG: DUF6765 family protein [Bacteroidales bacterium]
MDIDFHYYATYTAARLAGFSKNDAVTVAHAAQYVDNSNYQQVFRDDYSYWLKDTSEFRPHQTVQENSELGEAAANPLRWNQGFTNKMRRIWACFHFLPANYGDNPGKLEYQGPRVHGNWRYDDEAERCFKMLCLPNSRLAKLMINDLVSSHRDAPYRLHLIGLRMHTLADTWAHTFYAGTPAWWVNDAGETVRDLTTNPPTNVEWGLAFTDERKKTIEMATPPSPFYTSMAYLGHGRMGHVPDHPWIKYEYSPQWKNGTLTKDNPVDFLKAFNQLVAAMRCILAGTPFDANSPSGLSDATQKSIESILRTANEDKRLPDKRCELWRKALDTVAFDGTVLGAPPAYDAGQWLNELKQAANQKATHYYQFNKSASLHIDLISRELKNDTGIAINEDVDSQIVTVRMRTPNSAFVGELESGTQYYPRISSEGVVLQLILEAGKAVINSGDKVRIRTTESAAGEYNELGAWATHALYYYTRNYDQAKQSWTVEKVYGSDGPEIRPGDTVRFKNVSYQQNIVWYDYNGSSRYLTTSNSTAGDSEWVLESPEQPSAPLTYKSKLRLQSDNGDYVGPLESGAQYYPKLGHSAVGLIFTLASDENSSAIIRNGDVVKIRTSEDEARSYTYLGAWSTRALYYYTKDYDLNKQTWRIQKLTNPDDPQVYAGDKLLLCNLSWTDKPYITRYEDGGSYLTTQGNAGIAQAQWVVRAV